jgi:MFS family permease
MQSSWAIGYGVAILVNWFVQSVLHFDWRMVFFVGVLPALFTLWLRRSVEEPKIWRDARAAVSTGSPAAHLGHIFTRPFLIVTIALALMSSFTLFGYWGFNLWVPTYLSTPVAQGGIGLGAGVMSALLLANQAGTWLGYVSFGFIADAVGRKRAYVVFLLAAAVLVWAYASVNSIWALLALGPVCSFFATGHFSGFGLVTAEIYPTRVRATAQGFTYNVGRIASAAAPWLAGETAKSHGYPAALMLSAAAFFLASICWFAVPETRGRTIS